MRKLAQTALTMSLAACVVVGSAFAQEEEKKKPPTLEEMTAKAKKRFDDRLESMRKRGEPVKIAELAPPELPADENAATLYQQALEKMEEMSDEDERAVWDLVFNEGKLEGDALKQTREFLTKHADILGLLRKGTRRAKCRYDIDYSVLAYSILLPQLSRVQQGARMLSWSARVNLSEGKPDKAADDCISAIKLARSVDGQPILISVLVRLAGEGIALKEFGLVMEAGGVSREKLLEMSAALGDVEDRTHLVRAMKGERCMGLSAIQLIVKDPKSAAQLFSSSGSRRNLMMELSMGLMRPMFYMWAVDYLDLADENVELSKAPWHKSKDGWKRVAGRIRSSRDKGKIVNLLIAMLLPALERAGIAHDRGVTWTACAKLAIALRLYRMKHDEYPDKLTQLVEGKFIDKLPTDPFSGKGYIYRKEGKGFIVYGVGQNGVDDGGMKVDPKDRDRGDLVWRCER